MQLCKFNSKEFLNIFFKSFILDNLISILENVKKYSWLDSSMYRLVVVKRKIILFSYATSDALITRRWQNCKPPYFVIFLSFLELFLINARL